MIHAKRQNLRRILVLPPKKTGAARAPLLATKVPSTLSGTEQVNSKPTRKKSYKINPTLEFIPSKKNNLCRSAHINQRQIFIVAYVCLKFNVMYSAPPPPPNLRPSLRVLSVANCWVKLIFIHTFNYAEGNICVSGVHLRFCVSLKGQRQDGTRGAIAPSIFEISH